MPTLHVDLESRSTVDLRKTGAYVYAKHSETEVLLAAWAIDDQPVKWARIGEDTSELEAALADPSITVCAHNANFERLMFTHLLGPRHGWPVPALERYDCTAARAARQSLPRALDQAAAALRLDVAKDMDGRRLMLQMAKPRAARKDEAPGIYWWDDAERMHRLGEYCATDVRVEHTLDKVLKPLSPEEKAIWQMTERMNDLGLPLDIEFARQALTRADEAAAELNFQMRQVTKGLVSSASNVGALKTWLRASFGIAVLDTDDDALDKAAIAKVLEREIPAQARRALEIRLEAGKTSSKKYQAMIDRTCPDNRARGNLIYHGASTGRWAGSGIQCQNLPRVPFGFDIEKPIATCSLDDLSKMLRSVIRSVDGKLAWGDFASVEARGVAWLAGCDDLVALFAADGKVYESMAATVFKTTPDKIGKDSLERFIGKTIVLGCGYGMGAAKFRETCTKQGQLITEELAKQAITAYRTSYPEIPALWKGLEQAAIAAVGSPGQGVTRFRSIQFRVEGRWLQMRLPSGRCLWYRNPRVISVNGPYGERPCLEYDAQNSMTRKWQAESSWGGRLTENAVQAICRDLIAGGMLALEKAGYTVLMSVHDEVICEVPADFTNTDEMVALMCTLPEWAKGFPLKAEGSQGKRYGK